MLPNIRKPSGITKTVQISFGGYDRRPDARDGTFRETVGMSQREAPVIVSGEAPKRLSGAAAQGLAICAVGDVLLRCFGGNVYANNVLIGHAAEQERIIPFGQGAVLAEGKILVDLSVLPKGTKTSKSQLPSDAAEGDAWLVPAPSGAASDQPQLWVRENAAWVNKGAMLRALEVEVSIDSAIFCSGTYMGEEAVNNCILQADNMSEQFPDYEMPNLKEYFKPGDAVTIHSGIEEFDQTLIIREVAENELRFYENTFPNLVARHTVLGNEEVGPGLYMITGWDRFEPDDQNNNKPKKYFVIPSGTTLTAGKYIEYRYQDCQFSPLNVTYNTATIDIYQADGTHAGSIVPRATYSKTTYPDGPKALSFEAVDTGEDLIYGRLDVTITKKWPEGLRAAFADSNRLWGWEGRTLRASKLGDPSNWEFFDGTAEDSWAVELQWPDQITGGISAHGYPTFFTERRRIRVYGLTPTAYQLSELDCNGVLRSCEDSLAIVDGALYYVSGEGMMRDDGAAPILISQAFGQMRLQDAVAGGCGSMLMVSGVDGAGTAHLCSYDIRSGVWIHMAQKQIAVFTAAEGRIFAAGADGLLYDFGAAPSWGSWVNVAMGSAILETNDYTIDQPNTKRVHRVQLRLMLEQGARVEAAIMYDESGTWISLAKLQGDGARRSVYLPVLPRRCDRFRLRFTANGNWRLESLALELRSGAPERRPGPRYTV